MGDEVKAPATETPPEAVADEPTTPPSTEETNNQVEETEVKVEDTEEKPENVSESGEEKDEPVAPKGEEDWKRLKSKLDLTSRERELLKKENEYLRSQHDQAIAKLTPGKKKSEELEEKLRTITDPIEYHRVSKESILEDVREEITAAQSKERYKAELWNGLYNDYPDLKDPKSEFYRLTDALMRSRNLVGEKELFAGRIPIYAELVKTQIELTKQSEKQKKIATDVKQTQQTKLKQTGLPQPGKADTITFSNMSVTEQRLAKALGLKPEHLKEK